METSLNTTLSYRSEKREKLPKVFCLVEVRIRCRPDKFLHAKLTTVSWTLLVVRVRTGRSSSPNCSNKVGSLGCLKHKEFLSLEIRVKSNLKNDPCPVPPPPTPQAGQHCSPGNGPTQTCSSDWPMCPSKHHICTAPEPLAALYTPDSYMFHCT